MGCYQLPYLEEPVLQIAPQEEKIAPLKVVYRSKSLGAERTQRFYVIDPQGQFANPYNGMGNNPVMYIDPDGEFVFLPVIIGAVVGAASGTAAGIAAGESGLELFGYAFAGAAIGAVSGGVGSAVSSAVSTSVSVAYGGLVGAAAGGAAAGAISGSGFAALNGTDIGRGLWQGALSGFAGGAVGSYIGGGGGAFLGGATSGGLGTALNGGDLDDVLLGAGIGGALSYGAFEVSMHSAFQRSDKTLNYKQFRKLSVATQRSFARGREHGGWITEDDVILNSKLGKKDHIPAERFAPRPEGNVTKFHTHPNQGGDWSADFSDFGRKSDIQSMKLQYLLDRRLGQSTNFNVFSRNSSYSLSAFGAYHNIPSAQIDYGLYRYPFFHNTFSLHRRR